MASMTARIFSSAGRYGEFLYGEMSTSSALLQIGVFTAPGAMMMTSIPNSISSRRRLSDSPSIACLEAE